VVGVGNIIPRNRLLTRQVTNSRHFVANFKCSS
jgi:hypothetical protein